MGFYAFCCCNFRKEKLGLEKKRNKKENPTLALPNSSIGLWWNDGMNSITLCLYFSFFLFQKVLHTASNENFDEDGFSVGMVTFLLYMQIVMCFLHLPIVLIYLNLCLVVFNLWTWWDVLYFYVNDEWNFKQSICWKINAFSYFSKRVVLFSMNDFSPICFNFQALY